VFLFVCCWWFVFVNGIIVASGDLKVGAEGDAVMRSKIEI
jgi:hypothetical protein